MKYQFVGLNRSEDFSTAYIVEFNVDNDEDAMVGIVSYLVGQDIPFDVTEASYQFFEEIMKNYGIEGEKNHDLFIGFLEKKNLELVRFFNVTNNSHVWYSQSDFEVVFDIFD